jgi:hypothetical protein
MYCILNILEFKYANKMHINYIGIKQFSNNI